MGAVSEYESRPQSVAEFIDRLDRSTDQLPKRLAQCATHTRRHLHMLPVSTVSEMAKSADVAPSAYMRFCQVMGFSGYSELQQLFRSRFTDFQPQKNENEPANTNLNSLDTAQLLAEVVESSHRSLLALSNTATSIQLEIVAQAIAKARVVHLVGVRRSYTVVSNLSYWFDKIGVPAISHFGSGVISVPEVIFPGDVLFAVTYAPYSQETIELARHANSRDVEVFGLSDFADCPLKEYSKEILIVKEDNLMGFAAPTASNALTTALVIAVSKIKNLELKK